MITTQTPSFTEFRSRNLTLDEFQTELESYLGLSLDRGRCDEAGGSCELVATSPTGIRMFKIHLFRTERDGWQFGGHGELLEDSYDHLIRMHQEAVETEI